MPLWNLVKIAQEVSEKKLHNFIQVYSPVARAETPLIITKMFYSLNHTVKVSAISL